MSLSLSRPSSATLEALVDEQSAQPLSYAEVGATAHSVAPEGYRHGRQVLELGRGEDVFQRAADGLFRWQAHIGAGAMVAPPGAAVSEGLTVVVAIPVAVVWVRVACRVVYVVDQPARRGFAYGTLPHHVIEGEEAFSVERDEAEAVRVVVSAFLRPRGLLLRAAGPLVHRVDQRLVRRYLRGLHDYVTAPA